MANHSTSLFEAKRFAGLCSFQGSIGRLAFLGWYVLLVVYALIWIAVASAMARLIREDVVAVLAAIPVVWVALVLQVKRLHDMDISGWHALWMGP